MKEIKPMTVGKGDKQANILNIGATMQANNWCMEEE
jgi:hypothetical protein